MTLHSASPEVFDRWAAVYDDSANPFCALESRLVEELLPSLRDKTVLDLGCGTGRHFALFTRKSAAFLYGVDYSEQMLATAKKRLPENGTLHCAECTCVPLPDQTIDIVVCSFVLGYISDLQSFCREVKRLLRPGGQMLVADVHTATAERFAWKRSFRTTGHEISIQWNHQSVAGIQSVFEKQGFRITSSLGVPFSESERPIFDHCGRVAEFEKHRNHPALYILQLQVDESFGG